MYLIIHYLTTVCRSGFQ